MPQPVADMVVLIPGILGSVLADRDGREVWGSGRSILTNLLPGGGSLKDLTLPAGLGHEDPQDGVTAPRCMADLGAIPRFFKVDGYGVLVRRLREATDLRPATEAEAGNFLEFPYDWRLSNQLTAKRLAAHIIPALERWRKASHNPNAKLIFLCHSMGGLIARYFLEVLGGREYTRKLITLGTPYRGSMNALNALVNGYSLNLGPFGITLDELVRSLPSAYQLLPTYDCLVDEDLTYQTLDAVDLPNLTHDDVKRALDFHAEIAKAVEVNRTSPPYETYAIKGVDQPTYQSAQLRDGKAEMNRYRKGQNYYGDGTVPRPSAHPPEWPDDREPIYVSQSHAVLQSTDSVISQVLGGLTRHLDRFMGGTGLGLHIPDLIAAGTPLPVEVISTQGEAKFALTIICQGQDGRVYGNGPLLMRPAGDGRYHATLSDLPEGAYKITVQSATPARPLDPVSDWTVVWTPQEKG